MVVLEFAKSDRARCRTCNQNIDKGVLKIGTAVAGSEGYLNMEWHHEECFWTKRALKYYKRGNKKINVLLKLSQFSNQHILDADGQKSLEEKLRECNLKNGTRTALLNAGLVEPTDEEANGEENPAPKKKRKKSSC